MHESNMVVHYVSNNQTKTQYFPCQIINSLVESRDNWDYLGSQHSMFGHASHIRQTNIFSPKFQ